MITVKGYLILKILPKGTSQKKVKNHCFIALVSNSSPRAKVGPQSSYIWPTKQYQTINRTGQPVLYSTCTTQNFKPRMLCWILGASNHWLSLFLFEIRTRAIVSCILNRIKLCLFHIQCMSKTCFGSCEKVHCYIWRIFSTNSNVGSRLCQSLKFLPTLYLSLTLLRCRYSANAINGAEPGSQQLHELHTTRIY